MTWWLLLFTVLLNTLLLSFLNGASADYVPEKHCNRSSYGAESPSTLIPPSVDLSSSDPKMPSESELLKYYAIGHQECTDYLATHSDTLGTETLFVTKNSKKRNYGKCRGNALLYQSTGLLAWAFGPQNCLTHSRCWMGVLTCGNFKKAALSPFLHDGARNFIPAFWSPRALVLHGRLIGPEVLYLNFQSATLPYTGRAAGDRNEKEDPPQVLFASYVLTVPGDFRPEIRLHMLHYNMLKPMTAREWEKGLAAEGALYLGGSEVRSERPFGGPGGGPGGKPLAYTCCGCPEKAVLMNTGGEGGGGSDNSETRSIQIHVDSGAHRCAAEWAGGPWGVGAPGTGELPPELPFCSGGKNPGRWLEIPRHFAAEYCATDLFLAQYNKFAPQGIPLPGALKVPFAVQDATVQQYFDHIDAMPTPTAVQDALKEEILSYKAPSSTEYSAHDLVAKQHEAAHNAEVYRYSTGNMCTMFNAEPPRAFYDHEFSLYAPYECRYRLLSGPAARQCLKERKLDKMYFYGDSLTRALMGDSLRRLQAVELSQEQLKALSKQKSSFLFKNDGLTASMDFGYGHVNGILQGVRYVTLSDNWWLLLLFEAYSSHVISPITCY